MTQDEQKSFNDDYEIQQQLYKSLQPIFQEKMKFLSEEEKDALEEKGKGVKEVNQRVGIETEETKTELNEGPDRSSVYVSTQCCSQWPTDAW